MALNRRKGRSMRVRRSGRSGKTEGRSAPPCSHVRCDVEFLVSGVLYEASAENLSVRGAFVAAEVSVYEGLPVDISLTLDEASYPIQLVGKVVQLVRRRDERPGFAVEFEYLDDVTRARIRAVTEAA